MEIATPPRDHIPRGGVVRRIVDTRYRFRVSTYVLVKDEF